MIFPNIAMSAHVGGLVAGVIGGIVIAGNPKYIGIYILFSVLIFLGMNNYLASSY
jgi:hypothetical protein